jgi:hypothetical protein
MSGILRVNLLYNTVVRTKKDIEENRPGVFRPGLLAVAKSAFYENFVLKDATDPYVPGTDVPRLKLLHLAANATAVFNDELAALVEGLKRWRDSTPAPTKVVGKPKAVKPVATAARAVPAKRRSAPRSRSTKSVSAETTAA